MKKKMLGVMIDCSRNAVMNLRTIKQMVDVLAKMGYNTLMLYTEDTYEVDNQPFFGHQRGKYTKAELKELDAYCNSKGVELVPCIQTLAHLNCMFKWYNAYEDIRDCDDILLIGEEKTYQLIRDMFATLSECFTSKRIHIGMDEAHNIGRGKYLDKNGYRERFDVINEHLHKVCEIAKEFDFEPMIWSDMFCKLALGNDDYYQVGDMENIQKRASLPDNVSLVYWDYYGKEYERYANMLKVNQAFGKEVIFAGGAWTWKGFAPDNQLSFDTTLPALKACKDVGVDNIFITVWGDDGGECARAGVLPSLFYAAQLAAGNEDMEDIKKKFKELIGMDMDSFVLLDKMDMPGTEHFSNPSKYLLYNDPFMGLLDYKVSGDENQYYEALGKELDKVLVNEEYQPMFNYIRALCDALAIKSELGVRTRSAYKKQDKESLRMIAKEDYAQSIERVRKFHDIYQEWWMSENKPQGFELQDIRIGGLICRLESCQKRILEYCEGKADSIPELEEPILEDESGVTWARIVTPGAISHLV